MSLGEFIKTPNTIGLWHFNGNANDSSGNSLNGSDINTVIYSKANGKFNEGAGGFASNNSVIRVEDNNLLDLTTFTISIWFKVNTTWSGCIIGKFKGGQYYNNYYIDTDGGSNRVRFQVGNGTAWIINMTVAKSLTSGVWYNLICTVGSGTAKAYINGQLISTATYSGTPAINSFPVTFGARLSSNGVTYDSYLDGCIDEAIIKNIILDQVQISKYYTQSLGRYASI